MGISLQLPQTETHKQMKIWDITYEIIKSYEIMKSQPLHIVNFYGAVHMKSLMISMLQIMWNHSLNICLISIS